MYCTIIVMFGKRVEMGGGFMFMTQEIKLNWQYVGSYTFWKPLDIFLSVENTSRDTPWFKTTIEKGVSGFTLSIWF